MKNAILTTLNLQSMLVAYIIRDAEELYINLESMEFDTPVCVGGNNILPLSDVSSIFPPTIKVLDFGMSASWTDYSRDVIDLSLL